MAVYKVPQDVEAEDKLIGPFGFRQFIYLIIAALGILAGYLLSRLFIGLAILPLPIIALFLVLALPLRKDQPMETYLIAVINFFLKPRKRLWIPDGAVGLVEVTAPKTIEQSLVKDISGDEAAQRLSYLAQVVDTRGWATRGAMPTGTVADGMIDDVAAEANQAPDVLAEDTPVAQSFNNMISQNNSSYKQTVKEQFQQAWRQPVGDDTPPPAFSTKFSMPDLKTQHGRHTAGEEFNYDPYPNSMHQRVIFPAGQQPAQPPTPIPADQTAQTPPPAQQQPAPQTAQAATNPTQMPQTPSEPAVSPDIMRLASNNDLSISAIAHEAHRLEERDDNEVVISLR
jgi:hypothetical protein